MDYKPIYQFELFQRLDELSDLTSDGFFKSSIEKDYKKIFALQKEIKVHLQTVKFDSKYSEDLAWERYKQMAKVVSEKFEAYKATLPKKTGRISDLEFKIDKLEKMLMPSFWNIQKDWPEIFSTIKEIHETIENTFFPTKQDREKSWFRFKELKLKANNDCAEEQKSKTKENYDRILNELYKAEAVTFLDRLAHITTVLLTGGLSLLVLGTDEEFMKEQMILAGQHLRNGISKFNLSKKFFTEETKNELELRILQLKKDHDQFWHTYNEFKRKKYLEQKEKIKEREDFRLKSEQLTKEINYDITNAVKSLMGDSKALKAKLLLIQGQIKEAHLDKNQRGLLKDSLNNAFSVLKEINEAKKEKWEKNQREWKEKQELFQQRKDNFVSKQLEYISHLEASLSKLESIEQNIENGCDRDLSFLRKLEGIVENQKTFLNKLETHLDDLNDKYRSAKSSSFQDKVEGWINEKKDKISEVEESIVSLKSKIDDVEDKIDNAPKRLREIREKISTLKGKVNEARAKLKN